MDLSKPGIALLVTTFSLAAIAAMGCGSSSKPVAVVPDPTAVLGLPSPPAPGPVNTYNGGQSPGTWTWTFDTTQSAFSYRSLTYPASPNQPVTGSIQSLAGFSSLGAGGLALELPGRAALLRPGGPATTPVFGVPQTECYVITGKQRFQYIAMFPGTQSFYLNPNTGPTVGYGSIVASTDTTGNTWQFENLQGNVVSGPASFTAACSGDTSQASLAIPSTSLLDTFWTGKALTSIPTEGTVSTLWVGPSGFISADQSDPTQASPTGASIAGLAEPASPLPTPALAAAQYLGFLYQAPVSFSASYPTTAAFAAPLAFGQVAASGSTMTGGLFPGDDVTALPNADMQINLGKEDATLNGLYKSVAITVLDPAQNCANFPGSINGFPISSVVSGINDQGYITCTFPAVAVAGNPDGKYAIFLNSYNWAANLGGVPMQIYLFQR